MAKKSLKEKVEEKHPTFVSMIKDMRTQKELEDSLVVYMREKEGLVMAKERDEELKKLKERKAEISKAYNQTISAIKKMKHCIYKFGYKFEGELREQFEKNLVEYEKQLSSVEFQKQEDEELNAISDLIKQINEDYNPTIQDLDMKCKYVSLCLKEKFQNEDVNLEL
jgi:transketolase